MTSYLIFFLVLLILENMRGFKSDARSFFVASLAVTFEPSSTIDVLPVEYTAWVPLGGAV